MANSFPGTVFHIGSTGEAVKQIQERLRVQQTGSFGQTTAASVRDFQAAHSLAVNGMVGLDTWNALFAPAAEPADLRRNALQIARGLIGVEEHPRGSNRGSEVDKFLNRAGVPPGNPWCMAFVYTCVDDAAKQLGIANPMAAIEDKGSCSAVFHWAKTHNKLVSSPIPGDIFLCVGGESGHYHTGFVAGAVDADSHFATLEGNSNNDGSAEGYAVVKRSPGRRVTSCDYVRL